MNRVKKWKRKQEVKHQKTVGLKKTITELVLRHYRRAKID